MSASEVLLLCALSTVWLFPVAAREDLMVVCPDDYSPSPSEDCVPLHQLLSTLHLIHSNTTIQLLPAVFKLGPDLSISIANVSNITVGAAGPHRATISCMGSNSGFVFNNVSGLTVQNINHTNFSVTITESIDIRLINVKFIASGVYAESICGNFITSNALFAEMVYSTGFTMHTLKHCSSELHVTITNAQFLDSHCSHHQFCAAYFTFGFRTRLYLTDVAVKGNVANNYPLLYFATTNDVITLERFRLEDNKIPNATALHTSAMVVFGMKNCSTDFTLSDSTFSGNDINILVASHTPNLLVSNVTFSNNKGTALLTFPNGPKNVIVVLQSIFTNNTSTDWNSIVYLADYISGNDTSLQECTITNDILFQDCTFSNNSGTGLMLVNSVAEFAGTNLFSNNHAQSGAAISLQLSRINIREDKTALYIQGNVAQKFGGGVYIVKKKFEANKCSLENAFNKIALIYFDKNVAHLAGNDIYGGNLYSCTSDSSSIALHSPPGYKMDMSSTPIRVCECSERNIHTCIQPAKIIGSIETFPGKKFNLSLLAVGQVVNITLLSGVPSAVYAYILPQKLSAKVVTGSIPSGMLIQKNLRTCSNLTYSINSTREDETLVLSLGGLTTDEIMQDWLRYPKATDILYNSNEDYVPAYVKVYFRPCPAGFNLSLDGACTCSDALQDFDVECNIDTLMIHRKSPHFWLAVNISSCFSTKVLAHRHCPFDYCRRDVLDFSLADTDALCNHNRSGILCGACRSGYSLILGGTECRQCSNIYLLLLLPFALAGILLVVFLSLTDMTVAAGTINGLLFYANIVTDNKATFFPSGAEDSFLSVFVQWLSLDLGIKSCFFNGLDAYTFTWLQLVFPVYVCLLAFTIIIAGRYITWMNKLCGTNIVQVLATLFLLSYTKLQATIASGLSFTAVEVYDEEKLFVWLKDGNVSYLQGKHIALFLVSLLLLCVFSLYTLSIAFGPWLQRKTQYKVFCWVLKLKPLFDAYFGPLKNQYRYWTGLLLLSRTVLYLVSSVNVFGDDSINLLAITILCLFLIWQSRCVYKCRVLSALDSFFLINLCILSLVSLYNKLSSGGSQTVTIYVSSGSAFAVFCVTLLYHSLSRLKKAITQRRHNTMFREEISALENSDDGMINIIDANRK